ncbi:MAG TPA: class I SAM-dependent methyltransferase [Candidatus Polarisedimenticolaceae bacterium]|nr:class I SAM-dependent methyltransferase [Candidatus Polarisedimenticolaceae bacterium]
MSTPKAIYDERYRAGYRKDLGGYERARWKALEHFVRSRRLTGVQTVLDYGSGSGLHLELWERLFPRASLHFTDISAVALQQLAATYPRHAANTAELAGDRAPFADASFDVVVSVEVMEHVEDVRGYLADIFRLLKPGGQFIWTTPCGNSLSIEHLYNVCTRQIKPTAEGYRLWTWEDPTHLRRLKTEEVRGLAAEAGFQRVSFKLRSHLFSFACTKLCRGPLRGLGEKMMGLDYSLFRNLPNGASMLGVAVK